MTEVTSKLIYKPNGAYPVAFVEDSAGRLRRATAEEEMFWTALQETLKRLEEAEAKTSKRR